MWCRLITGEKSAAVQAMPWQRAGVALLAPAAGEAVPLYRDPGPDYMSAGRQLEQELAAAYQRGLREGAAEAALRMSEQMNATMRDMARSIEQLALHRARIQREAEPELVRLSLAIARRVLRRELSVDPEALLGLLKAGLEKMEASEAHQVRVNPAHAGVLAKLLDGAARPVAVAADPGLPMGAVVFETSRGSLDVGFETQLGEIERGFADIYPR